jgi:multimeric flavodoxin WrbA
MIHMKILVWNGSPRKNGNTARLIASFVAGAGEAGHEVMIEQVAGRNICGCLACEYFHDKQRGIYIQQDDMQELYRRLKEADMLVLA